MLVLLGALNKSDLQYRVDKYGVYIQQTGIIMRVSVFYSSLFRLQFMYEFMIWQLLKYFDAGTV